MGLVGHDWDLMEQTAFQIGYQRVADFYDSTPRTFYNRLIAYLDEQWLIDSRQARLIQSQYASMGADPPHYADLMGIDGTPYDQRYITKEEADLFPSFIPANERDSE